MKKKTKIIIMTLTVILLICLVGCDSAQSVIGIQNAAINENGELILTYTNGEEQNLGIVVGKDGIDGKNGVDGKDGKDGIDGKDGTDGKDGVDGKDGTNGSSDSVSQAVNLGLRSSVNVFCSFTSPEGEYSSAGSGVIYKHNNITGSAFIITNHHVVYDANSLSKDGISDNIMILLYGSEYSTYAIEAEYVGGSMYYDIAVLYVEKSDLLINSFSSEVIVADSDEVSVGDVAIAIGNAKSSGISASTGIISVDSEHIQLKGMGGNDFRVMRIDAAVNPGNSGGGLFDINGHLIGIVNAKTIDESVENIGYAIPSNVAIAVTDNIIDHCFNTSLTSVQRPILGITIMLSDSRAVYNKTSGKTIIEEKIHIESVSETSPLSGKLKKYDEIISISINDNKKIITRQHQIIDFLLTARVGDTISIFYSRSGRTKTITFKLTKDYITSY